MSRRHWGPFLDWGMKAPNKMTKGLRRQMQKLRRENFSEYLQRRDQLISRGCEGADKLTTSPLEAPK